MQGIVFDKLIERVEDKKQHYHPDAYRFVWEALESTQAVLAIVRRGGKRQVTGQELLTGIRELGLAQFGPMAPAVFEEWGIRSCRDFGQIVFNMMEAGLLSSPDGDCRAEFEKGFDFYDAFRRPFLPPSRQLKPRRSPGQSTK
jgi:uncharacterized repeat protein (TIGR04138 family)